MLVAKTIAEIRTWRQNFHGTVGFIPTMGYLHDGHLSLIQQAKKENDLVVVSIFVNPKQFGPKEDFTSYPHDTARDLQFLKDAKVDVVFLPELEEMYPAGFESKVSVTGLSKRLEGKRRPGHFDGVATVVSKLFNIVQPQKAYFGQKDVQQVVVMKKLVSDLQFPLSIIVGETIRERDGLALSSRNVFLSDAERKQAAVLFQSLQLAQKLLLQGEYSALKIKNAMKKLIKTTDGRIDYISIANPESLTEVSYLKNGTIVSLAVYYGKTRLIDNCIV